MIGFLICPRCPRENLLEVQRGDVTIDACLACRGVWLDRGELDKLIAKSRSDTQDLHRRNQHGDGPPSSDDLRRGKKKSWFDIFD